MKEKMKYSENKSYLAVEEAVSVRRSDETAYIYKVQHVESQDELEDVQYNCNCKILAYCLTEKEAKRVVDEHREDREMTAFYYGR